MQLVINPFSYKESGNKLNNPYLIGLPIRLNLRVNRELNEVYFYSSNIQGNRDNKFSMVYNDNVYSYFALAGQGAYDKGICQGTVNFDDGIIFYLSFYYKENGVLSHLAEKKIVIKNIPNWCILFGQDKQSYISPYVVLQGSRKIGLEFFPFYKNEHGMKQFGGINTVEILDNPDAPSDGNFVIPIAETNINNVVSLELYDRSIASKIPGYETYPGAPDFSNYFYFITFRFRSKEADTYYIDWNAIIFLARDCANLGISGLDVEDYEGYGSNGDGILPEIEDPPLLPPPTIETNGDYTITPPSSPPSYTPEITIITYKDDIINRTIITTLDDDGKIRVSKESGETTLKIVYTNPDQETQQATIESIDETFTIKSEISWGWHQLTSNTLHWRDNGMVARCYMNNVNLSSEITHTEVRFWYPDYDTFIYKTVFSSEDGGYLRPLIWNYHAYKNYGLMPQDYYKDGNDNKKIMLCTPNKFTGYTPLPGSGIYPPPGQEFNPTDLLMTQAIETLNDGTKRYSTKDITKKILYQRDYNWAHYFTFCYLVSDGSHTWTYDGFGGTAWLYWSIYKGSSCAYCLPNCVDYNVHYKLYIYNVAAKTLLSVRDEIDRIEYYISGKLRGYSPKFNSIASYYGLPEDTYMGIVVGTFTYNYINYEFWLTPRSLHLRDDYV